MKAIAKRREDRFASADGFREALAGLAGSLGSEAPPAPLHAALVSTVEQGPLLASSLPGHTVATSEVAITRPALPWAARPSQPPRVIKAGPRRPAKLPLWFVAIVILGVAGTVAAVAIYLSGVGR